MEKEKIKREELKSNFLRQMIIRVDYDYLFDEDIENIVKKRYKELIESGYKMNSNGVKIDFGHESVEML